MAHDSGRVCVCVNDHNPNPMELERHHIWPLATGGPDTPWNTVWLCPTTHMNVHELLREYGKLGGEPSWDYRRHFNSHARAVAALGWLRMTNRIENPL